MDIYVYMQGQRRGPYEKVQLETMWERGQIPADTLYWHDGMSKWAVISDLFAAGNTIASSLPEDAAPELRHFQCHCKMGGHPKTTARSQPRHAIRFLPWLSRTW